eukprot:7136629-Karenia_brevis.AAC.1
MVRLPSDQLVNQVQGHETRQYWSALQAAGMMCDPRNKARWKHPRPGPLNMWEDPYCDILGEDWRKLALDRALWISMATSVAWIRCERVLGQSNKLVSTIPSFKNEQALRDHVQSWSPVESAVIDSAICSHSDYLDRDVFGGLATSPWRAAQVLSVMSRCVSVTIVGDSD